MTLGGCGNEMDYFEGIIYNYSFLNEMKIGDKFRIHLPENDYGDFEFLDESIEIGSMVLCIHLFPLVFRSAS